MRVKKSFVIFFLIIYSFKLIVAFNNILAARAESNLKAIVVLGYGYLDILILAISITYFIFNMNIISKLPKIFLWAALFWISSLPSLLYGEYNFFDLIENLYNLSAWYFLLLLGYLFSFNNVKDKEFIDRWMTYVVLSPTAFIFLREILPAVTTGKHSVIDVVFLIIALYPFALSIKNDIVKHFFIALVGIVSLLSFKRSSILIYGIATLTNYLVLWANFRTKTTRRIFRGLFFALFLLMVYYVFDAFNSFTGEGVTQRFADVQITGGSGRDVLYADVFSLVKEADLFHLLCGHGYLSVQRALGMAAHNDFLEILYSYGLIALTFYMLFMMEFIVLAVKFYKTREIQRNNSAAFIAAFLSLIFLGSLNVFVLSASYYGTIMFFFGLTIGSNANRLYYKKTIFANQDSLQRV